MPLPEWARSPRRLRFSRHGCVRALPPCAQVDPWRAENIFPACGHASARQTISLKRRRRRPQHAQRTDTNMCGQSQTAGMEPVSSWESDNEPSVDSVGQGDGKAATPMEAMAAVQDALVALRRKNQHDTEQVRRHLCRQSPHAPAPNRVRLASARVSCTSTACASHSTSSASTSTARQPSCGLSWSSAPARHESAHPPRAKLKVRAVLGSPFREHSSSEDTFTVDFC